MREKQKYNVYFTETYFGDCGEVTKTKEFAGVTWASSKAKAENNVRFRENGAIPAWWGRDTGGDTGIIFSYQAVLAANDI